MKEEKNRKKPNRFEIKHNFFDFPELVMKFRSYRTNYDYPYKSIKTLKDCWFVIEAYIPSVRTTHGERLMLIISELKNPKDPESERTGFKYKVVTGSKILSKFFLDLRQNEDDLKVLPLTVKLEEITYTGKDGKKITRYDFWTDL